MGTTGGKKKGNDNADIEKAAEEDVEHIFNDTFREELRNRGRLHFEKIISENAMFLQQDLRLTTSQLNEYMKEEITGSDSGFHMARGAYGYNRRQEKRK
jgi:hypothetical protein